MNRWPSIEIGPNASSHSVADPDIYDKVEMEDLSVQPPNRHTELLSSDSQSESGYESNY